MVWGGGGKRRVLISFASLKRLDTCGSEDLTRADLKTQHEPLERSESCSCTSLGLLDAALVETIRCLDLLDVSQSQSLHFRHSRNTFPVLRSKHRLTPAQHDSQKDNKLFIERYCSC